MVDVSKRCKYALKAMFELALRNSQRPVKIHEVAAAQGVPVRFLEAIMNQLRKAGLVDSIRGSAGGYVLAKGPSSTTIGDIIAAVGDPLGMRHPSQERVRSDVYHYGDYALGQFWKEVHEAVEAAYQGMSLAHLSEIEKAHVQSQTLNYSI